MPFPKNTIKLGCARRVFKQFDIQEVKINDTVVGYSVGSDEIKMTDTSLTALCERLVVVLIGDAEPPTPIDFSGELLRDFCEAGSDLYLDNAWWAYQGTHGEITTNHSELLDLVEAAIAMGIAAERNRASGIKSAFLD